VTAVDDQGEPAKPRVRRIKTMEITPLGHDEFGFTARLIDESFGGAYGDDNASSVVIHDFGLEGALMGSTLEVVRLQAHAVTHPYDSCPFVLDVAQELVGTRLGSGWRKRVLAFAGGVRGCTHVNTLVLGLSEVQPLIFFLKMNESVPFTAQNRADGSWLGAGLKFAPQLADACFSLRKGGPVLGRLSPEASD